MTVPAWDNFHLRIATEAAGVALWSWNIDTDRIRMDELGFRLWGVPMQPETDFEALSGQIHPEDLDRVRAAFDAARGAEGPFEADFRILEKGDLRWISARGRSDAPGLVGRTMFGVFLDVTTRRQAEEAREMVTAEMHHRIKNLFSITTALASFAARSTTTKEEMTRDLMRRLHALSGAHDLVRPNLNQQSQAAPLRRMLSVLLKPYLDGDDGHDRIHIDVPELMVGEASATSLALIVHELATNSIKYGALSNETGRIDIGCTAGAEDIALVWRERDGPPLSAPAGQSGFGSQLVGRAVSAQLGGTIAVDWRPDGIIVTLRMSQARLAV